MLFGKKGDKKKLPDLPPPKGPFGSIGHIGGIDRSSLFDEDASENSLPSFPDSPGHNDFSQAIIKDAVSNKYDEGEEDVDEGREDDSKTMKMEEWKPSNFKANLPRGKKNFELKEEPEEEEIEESEDKEEEKDEENVADEVEEEIEEPPKFVKREYRPIKDEKVDGEERMNKDIFVKIDKFYSARKSLQEIRGKFEEMNELIRKIREIKLREEQELSMWEKEMGHVKSRIQHVTENIFEKID